MNSFRAVAVAISLVASCILTARSSAEQSQDEVRKITLHPQAAGRLPLEHRLIHSFPERIQGNAVVYLGMVKSEQTAFFCDRERHDRIDAWRTAPLDELRQLPESSKLNIGYGGGIGYYLEQAARCDHADWQLPIGREPYFEILLPAIQESRHFARILDAHARIEIANGNFAAAVRDFRNTLALGQHVAANETLVAGLVGLAISGTTATQLETFIQQPDAPNLYWSLAQLPHPLIDFREAVDAEVHAVEMTFPEVRDLDSLELMPEAWRARLLSLLPKVHEVADEKDWQPGEEYLDEATARLLPQAKEYLRDHGVSAEKLENMADHQIILLDLVRRNLELRQDAARWFFLPYPIASKGLKAAQDRAEQQWRDRRDIAPLPQLTAEPLYVVRRAQVRVDRQFAVLRILEALRIHAAATGGKLPAKLSDVTEAPIPDDPVTEKPFGYELKGTTAVLSGPALVDAPEVHPSYADLRYEITLAE